MKWFLTVMATFVLFAALGSARSEDVAALTWVSARKPHATRHHAHKAAKHHRPKHHQTV